MSVHRTQARVDNELIYDRQRFLGDINEATTVDLAVGDTAVEAGTVDAVILTVNLPNVAKARGKIYTVSGTNANAGQIHAVLSGTAQGDMVADANGIVRMSFYSDGRHWLPASGSKGADGADGADGTIWHHGAVTPADSLGNDGDYYLRTDTGGIYFKDTGTWGTPIVVLTPTT